MLRQLVGKRILDLLCPRKLSQLPWQISALLNYNFSHFPEAKFSADLAQAPVFHRFPMGSAGKKKRRWDCSYY